MILECVAVMSTVYTRRLGSCLAHGLRAPSPQPLSLSWEAASLPLEGGRLLCPDPCLATQGGLLLLQVEPGLWGLYLDPFYRPWVVRPGDPTESGNTHPLAGTLALTLSGEAGRQGE